MSSTLLILNHSIKWLHNVVVLCYVDWELGLFDPTDACQHPYIGPSFISILFNPHRYCLLLAWLDPPFSRLGFNCLVVALQVKTILYAGVTLTAANFQSVTPGFEMNWLVLFQLIKHVFFVEGINRVFLIHIHWEFMWRSENKNLSLHFLLLHLNHNCLEVVVRWLVWPKLNRHVHVAIAIDVTLAWYVCKGTQPVSVTHSLLFYL